MTKRETNIDLLRIISTFFVLILHISGQDDILDFNSGGASYWIIWFLETCAYCAVNCFALISGYVMLNKTTKSKAS